jgi:uncharacterized membrane protein
MDTTVRTLVKTLSYRITAAATVFLLSILLAYGSGFGVKFLIITLTLGYVIYFTHEFLWNKFNLLRVDGDDKPMRSLIKTISWRITSFIVMFFISKALGLSNEDALYWVIANNIAFLVVHYLHERVWNRITWGKKSILATA